MILASVAAAVAAAASLVTFALLWWRVSELQGAITLLAKRPPSTISEARAATVADQTLAALAKDLATANAALARLESALSRMKRGAEAPAVRTESVAIPNFHVVARGGPSQVEDPSPASEEADRPPVPELGSGPPKPEAPSDPLLALDELLDGYRQVIAQPRRSEINRWLDEAGGRSHEVGEDEAFHPADRDAGALLSLIFIGERTALVVPSARLVVDFATSFSDVLSLRSRLRSTFELDADGTGVLRLVEPALAVLADGVWKVKRPGRLSGLATA